MEAAPAKDSKPSLAPLDPLHVTQRHEVRMVSLFALQVPYPEEWKLIQKRGNLSKRVETYVEEWLRKENSVFEVIRATDPCVLVNGIAFHPFGSRILVGSSSAEDPNIKSVRHKRRLLVLN